MAYVIDPNDPFPPDDVYHNKWDDHDIPEEVMEAGKQLNLPPAARPTPKAYIATHAALIDQADALRDKASKLPKEEKVKLEESAHQIIAESANALRVKRWRENNRDTYLEQNRKAVAAFRARKSGKSYPIKSPIVKQ